MPVRHLLAWTTADGSEDSYQIFKENEVQELKKQIAKCEDEDNDWVLAAVVVTSSEAHEQTILRWLKDLRLGEKQ